MAKKDYSSRAHANPTVFIKSILTDKRIEFFRDYARIIKNEYDMLNITPEERERIAREHNRPIYSKRDFVAKYIELKEEKGELTDEFRKSFREEGEELYAYYALYIYGDVTGINKKYKDEIFRASYRREASKLGNQYIDYLVDKIFSLGDKDYQDMLKLTRKNTANSLLPNIALYYPKAGGIVDDEITDSIIDDLQAILDTFKVQYEDEDNFYGKPETEEIEEVNNRTNYFNKIYKRVNKELKERFATYKSGIIDDIEIVTLEKAYLKSREHTLRYSKTGNPYMPFVKSSLVRKYYAKKG